MKSRILFLFPIIHSQSEMGVLGQSILEITLKNLGQKGWQHKVAEVERFWAYICDIVLNNLSLPYENTRVYQDGLPICGKEDAIVADLAKNGSPNHQLLLRLKEKGAKIMGTELAEMLIEEYQLHKKILEKGNAEGVVKIDAQQKASGDLLLERRDAFIAARIDQTLQTGETGILFLGMLHKPIAYLAKDIQVKYPLRSFYNAVQKDTG